MTIPDFRRSPVRNRVLAYLSFIFLISAGQSGCRQDSSNDRLQMSLKVESPDFRQGEDIPKQFTCDGADVSPALSWQSPPANTKSLVLIVRDSDSLFGSFVHWILYNLPPESTSIAEALRCGGDRLAVALTLPAPGKSDAPQAPTLASY